jgi:hypothetical protein
VVSGVKFKSTRTHAFGPVLLDVKVEELHATKEDNLLFVVDDDKVFSKLAASDFYDGRYWYQTTAERGDSLPGFDMSGNPGRFKWLYPNAYKMDTPTKLKFRDDKNANTIL